MYAVIRTGGKQARVSEGDVLDVERIRSDDELIFTPLLVVGDDGVAISARDELAKIKVHARVVGETRGRKVEVFKYKAKTGYRKSRGHRQTYTTLEVTKIEMPGKAKAKPKADKAETGASEAAAAEKPAAKKPAAEKPAAEKPAAEKPAAEKPAAKKPAAEKPAAKKPAAEKPAAKKPAAKKPAATKPAAEPEKQASSETDAD